MNRSDDLVRSLRSTVIAGIGAYGFIHEVQGAGERPYLLVLCAVMMGVLPADMIDRYLQRRNGNGNGNGAGAGR